MEAAVAEYDQATSGSAAWMLGRFVVTAAGLIELRRSLAGRARIELSVISTPEMFEVVARTRHEGWATIAAIEVPLGDYSIGGCARQARRARLDDLPIYVESARQQLAMDKLAEHGLRAKLRCGGIKPSAFPSVAEVAAFIAATSDAGVAFKATAGLHHPVRHFNEAAGVTMHGFLNLLCAAGVAPKGDRSALEAIVGEEDPAALLALLEDEPAMRGARARFISYGSCSFGEPVDDLRALGVVAAV